MSGRRAFALMLLISQLVCGAVPQLRPYVPTIRVISEIERVLPGHAPSASAEAQCPKPTTGPDVLHCTYVVREGDSVTKLARRLEASTGEPCGWWRASIIDASDLDHPDHLLPEDVLKVPLEPVSRAADDC